MVARIMFFSQLMDCRNKIFFQQSTSVIARHHTNEFFITPSKSMFKKLFLGTHLGEQLCKMSVVKSTPNGLKVVECERGMGGKNSPIHYIPEQDLIHDALKKKQEDHVLQVDSTQHQE